jgi:hypothetical protein
MNIKGALWHSLRSTYSSYTDTICIGNKKSRRTQLKNGLRQGSALSPLLFILYINPLINKLIQSNTGLELPLFPPHNKVPCFMFVDDLILKPLTLEELKIQIDIVTKHGNDTGCIINLDEKKGITVSSSSRSGNITKLCTEHPLPLQHTPTYTYLGASHKPTAPTNFEHINLRLQKSHKKMNFMKSRGLAYGNIKPKCSTRIIQAILIPSVTYAMEAFQLSTAEYARLDHFLSTTLAITHGSPMHTTNSNKYGPKHQPSSLDIWNIWESDLHPPSITVQKAKFKLYHNTITSPHNTILKHMLNVMPQNSFINELYILQKEWGEPNLMKTIHTKPTKSLFKKILNNARDQAHINLLYKHLPSQWKFSLVTKNTLPAHTSDPANKKLMGHRAHHLFFPSFSNCLLCDIDTPDTTLHRLMTCQNILRKTSRERFWETLSNTCPRGSDYLNSLPTVQQLYIILELIEVNDERVQKTITEASHHILSII